MIQSHPAVRTVHAERDQAREPEQGAPIGDLEVPRLRYSVAEAAVDPEPVCPPQERVQGESGSDQEFRGPGKPVEDSDRPVGGTLYMK